MKREIYNFSELCRAYENPLDRAVQKAAMDALEAENRAKYSQALRFLQAAEGGETLKVEKEGKKIKVLKGQETLCILYT